MANSYSCQAQTTPLRARLLDGEVVYIGRRRGYSIAAVETGPIGYAITSDNTPMHSAQIVVSALSVSAHH